MPAPVVAEPREMDGDFAEVFIGAQERDLVGVDEQNRALGPVARIVVGPHAGALARPGIAVLRLRGARLGR